MTADRISGSPAESNDPLSPMTADRISGSPAESNDPLSPMTADRISGSPAESNAVPTLPLPAASQVQQQIPTLLSSAAVDTTALLPGLPEKELLSMYLAKCKRKSHDQHMRKFVMVCLFLHLPDYH